MSRCDFEFKSFVQFENEQTITRQFLVLIAFFVCLGVTLKVCGQTRTHHHFPGDIFITYHLAKTAFIGQKRSTSSSFQQIL